MFKIFQKKQNYNTWLTNEIKEAKNLGFNLEEYINANTHPLHAKQIKLASRLCIFRSIKTNKISII